MEATTKYPRTARATIRVEGGTIVVENQDGGGDLIRVADGGVIHWDCPADGSLKWWSIVMKTDTPFENNDGYAGSNRGRQGITRIRKGANGGGTKGYEYAIVGSDGSQVYFEDPEVEVGPDEPDNP